MTMLAAQRSSPAVSAGGFHTCALKSDGTVTCWGLNDLGQTTVPAGLTGVIDVSGGAYHTCALKSDGTVSCWGYSGDGQTTVPAGLTGGEAVDAGDLHTCVLKSDGPVICWGSNNFGQAAVPAGLVGVTAVSAGGFHTCALKSDGTVLCWGLNLLGQTTVPAGLTGVAAVSAGSEHTCTLMNNGTVTCWGDNQLGQATVPAGLASVTAVSAGGRFTCVVKRDGSVICWGNNDYGQTSVPAGLNVAGGSDYECVDLATGTFDNIVVPPGEDCTLHNAMVQGNVTALKGSRLFLQSNELASNQVHGSVFGEKARTVHITDATVGGSIVIKGGKEDPGCCGAIYLVMGTTVTNGNIEVTNNNGYVRLSGNVLLNGDIGLEGNVSSEFEVEFNDVGGKLQIVDNEIRNEVPFVVTNMYARGNRVTGDMQVYKNRGPGSKKVELNTVLQSLQCLKNDLPFVGGPNTAGEVEGQCF